jgi:hypothetical protein
MPAAMSRLLSTIGICTTLAYLAFLGYIFHGRADELRLLQPNHLGDFLAGVFGPLAILWLILGFFQQGVELRENSRALDLQAEELKNATREQRELMSILRQHFQAIREELALVRREAATVEQELPAARKLMP